MKSKQIGLFLRENVFYILIIVVGVGYIFSGMSQIVRSGETIDAIISAGLLTTILGLTINKLFGQKAIKDGFNDVDLTHALNSQAKAVEEIDPHIDKLDIYCEKENEMSMIRKRTRILKRVGITIEMFDKNDFGKLQITKRRKKAITRASNIGFGYLTSDWLLADLDDDEERNNKRTSIKKYVIKQDIKSLFTKIILGIVGGLYVLEPFVNANWNIILWRVFFFTLMLIVGYMRYVTDLNFITKDYRKVIISKTNNLIKFKTSLETHKEWYIEPLPIVEEVKEKYVEPQIEVVEEDYQPHGFGSLIKKGS